MRPEFEILPQEIDTTNTSLVFEISDCGISYFLQKEEDKFIYALSAYHFGKGTDINEQVKLLKDILENPILSPGKFNKIIVCYSFCECVLLPENIYEVSKAGNLLRLIHGDPGKGILLTDYLCKQNLYNVYLVPEELHHLIARKFPAARIIHQNSLLLNCNNEQNSMNVIFYNHKIVVTLVKTGKCQIIQAFKFDNSEDVVYHLLNVCHQFEAENVTLILAGMIERKSAMFEELHKYFLNIEFMTIKIVDLAEEIKTLPAHYFSHLFSISSCE